MNSISKAPRTAATLERVRKISDAMIANMMRKNFHNTQDYFVVMIRLAQRAKRLNEYGAKLEQEIAQ
jgi:hypothetical protein